MKLAILASAVITVLLSGASGQNRLTDVVFAPAGPIRGIAEIFTPRFVRPMGINSYLGIPYVLPPEDERRFLLPAPLAPWTDIYDATEVPPFCPQIIQSFSKDYLPDSAMQEDCLYLNVHVPARASTNGLRPVMVYIHGGGFETNSGSDYLYNPRPLVTLGDVIVVTFNYRLNIFGFLTTGDDAIPPNLGLLDQQMALRWVKANIAAFGGNPNMVTIFGESAGAVSVGYHLLAASSRDLFQRAIMQSGTPLNPWGFPFTPEQARDRSQRIAGLAQCRDLSSEGIKACLGSRTTEDLLGLVEAAVAEFEGDSVYLPMMPDTRIFESDVQTLIEQGDYRDKEILLGTNKDEATLTPLNIFGYPPEKPFVPKQMFEQFTQTTENPLLTLLLEAVYAQSIDDERNYLYALSDAFSDLIFTCPAIGFAKQAALAGSKTYMYHMTIEPVRSLFNVTWARSSHFEDIQFVFGLPFANHPFYTPVYDEAKVSYYVMQMWTNFAKSGNPNLPRLLNQGIPEWPQFVPGEEEYKELGRRFGNKNHLRQDYCDFWAQSVPEVITLQVIASGAGVPPIPETGK